MAISHNLQTLAERLPEPHGFFSGGISADFDFMPEDILVWRSSRSLRVSKTSIHQRMILKVILSGKCTMLIDGLRVPLKTGDMICLFPYQFHTTKLDCPGEKYSFLAITFTEKRRHYDSFLPLKNRVLHPDPQDRKNLEIILRNYLQPNHPEQCVFALLAILLNQRNKVGEYLPVRPDQPELFDRICNHVRTHFQEALSIKMLAEEFAVTPETIRRTFLRAAAGITPGKLILRLRMQHAVDLLEHTEESIAFIAGQCGFPDAFSFSRSFRNAMGHSPRQHRQLFQQPASGRLAAGIPAYF